MTKPTSGLRIFSWYITSIGVLLPLTKLTLRREFLYLAQVVPAIVFFAKMAWCMRVRRPKGTMCFVVTLLALLVLWVMRAEDKVGAAIYLISKYSVMLSALHVYSYGRNTRESFGLLRHIAFVGTCSAIYSAWQTIIGYPAFEDRWAETMGYVHGVDVFVGEFRRAPGISVFSSSNSLLLSAALFAVFPTAVCGRRKLLAKLNIALLIAGLAFSQTRGIWLGCIIGFAMTFVILIRHKCVRVPHILVIVGLLAGVFVGVTMAFEVVRTRVQSFSGMLSDPNHPFMFRVLLWLNLISEYWKVLLIGMGTGAAGSGGRVVSRPTPIGVVDNMYLNLLFSTGVLGLLVFIVLIVGLIRFPEKPNTSLECHHEKRFLICTDASLVGFIVAFCVSCLTGDYLESFPGNLFFWVAVGILSLHHRLASLPTRKSRY